MKPLVSVIIPTFNRIHLLKRSIQSALNQTYERIELIIIDNFSNDGTKEYISELNDERIIFKQIHNNGNIAISRNEGIRSAKGEWIAFLDSDDWWRSNKISYCLSKADSGTDLIYHKLEIFDEFKRKYFKKNLVSRKLHKPITKNLLLMGNVINNSSVMVRRNILDRVNGINQDTGMITAEDYNTWLKISAVTENFLFINAVLGFYQIHESNYQRNMYLPTKLAAENFTKCLSDDELTKYFNNLEYIRIIYLINSNKFNFEESNFVKLFLSFSLLQKIKLIFLLINKLIIR